MSTATATEIPPLLFLGSKRLVPYIVAEWLTAVLNKGVDGIVDEFHTIRQYTPYGVTAIAFTANAVRNRYSKIVSVSLLSANWSEMLRRALFSERPIRITFTRTSCEAV